MSYIETSKDRLLTVKGGHWQNNTTDQGDMKRGIQLSGVVLPFLYQVVNGKYRTTAISNNSRI